MLEKLINSQTRLAVLNLLFKHPDKIYSAKEIGAQTKLDAGNLHKELANLVVAQFIVSSLQSGQKVFGVNQKSPFFSGLQELFSRYDDKNAGGEVFISIEDMPNYYPMMTAWAWNAHSAADFFTEFGFKNSLKHLLSAYKENICSLFVPREEFSLLGQEILDKAKTDNAWGERYFSEVHRQEQLLYQASFDLQRTNLKRLSDQELYQVFEDYYRVYFNLHRYHWLQTAADFGDSVLSRYLFSYLKTKVSHTQYSLGDVFSVLTTPTEEPKSAEEYQSLLEILAYIIGRPSLKSYFSSTESRLILSELDKFDPKLSKMISIHTDNFGWLGYGTVGPAWDKHYFIDILSSLIRQQAEPQKLMSETKNNRLETAKRQAELIKELKIDKQHQDLFVFARNLVFSKGTRKDAMFNSYFVSENLFKEIGRRFYLSVRQVRYLLPEEFKDLMINKNFPVAVLNERYHEHVHYSSKDKPDVLLLGKKAQDFLNKINIFKEEIGHAKILLGDCASPGRARGKVKIVNTVGDMTKMNQGDILVSVATTPELVPAIKKAAAIVTDVGGITCHAAIISRELGLPCVVGTKFSTRVLHDGDTIDVNATHGKINIISVKKTKKA